MCRHFSKLVKYKLNMFLNYQKKKDFQILKKVVSENPNFCDFIIMHVLCIFSDVEH